MTNTAPYSCNRVTPGVKVAKIPHLVTRFAPSPTGALHLGHALSAVTAHDAARTEADGQFLLRIEDIDGGRSRPEYVDGIYSDLEWLGLRIDGPVVFQSARIAHYVTALEQLKTMGLVYPCFCTRAEIAAEIAASVSAPHTGPDRPVYPGTCRSLAPGTRNERLDKEGHCWRLDMTKALVGAGPLLWTDQQTGDHLADPARFGDVVLARKDAGAAYHLAATVDDAEMGVTLIIRGRDLFDATDVHRLLQALLGLSTPLYAHHALVVDATGKRLAKRDEAASLKGLRDRGMNGRDLSDMIREGRLPLGFGIERA